MVNTSGAPLPKDSSVAPATAGGSLRRSAMYSRAGQKKRSAAVRRKPNVRASAASSSSTETQRLRGRGGGMARLRRGTPLAAFRPMAGAGRRHAGAHASAHARGGVRAGPRHGPAVPPREPQTRASIDMLTIGARTSTRGPPGSARAPLPASTRQRASGRKRISPPLERLQGGTAARSRRRATGTPRPSCERAAPGNQGPDIGAGVGGFSRCSGNHDNVSCTALRRGVDFVGGGGAAGSPRRLVESGMREGGAATHPQKAPKPWLSSSNLDSLQRGRATPMAALRAGRGPAGRGVEAQFGEGRVPAAAGGRVG
jgi:hypothetical protein